MLTKPLKKMLKEQETEIRRLEAELVKRRKKVEAIRVLADEEIQEGQQSLNIAGKKQRGEIISTLKGVLPQLPATFHTPDLTAVLATRGVKYPSSTISTTLLRFIKIGLLREGERIGKGRTYIQVPGAKK